MKKPFASFIVVNFNGEKILRDCLESLLKQSDSDFEVIMVDNGSLVSWKPFVPKELYNKLTVIENPNDTGFAPASNQGISAASGKWIIIINNDVVLDDNFLSRFREETYKYPNTFIFTPKVLIQDLPDYIDSSGLGVFMDGIARCRGWQEPEKNYRLPAEVLGATGSVAIFHKKVFNDIGLFDEGFFMYLEDLDIALRAVWHGYKCQYLPGISACHKHSSTVGKHTIEKAYLVERNHIWVALKNFPLTLLVIAPFYTVYRYLLQGYAAFTHQGITSSFFRTYSWKQRIQMLFMAYRDAILGIPKALRERKKIMRSRRVSSAVFLKIILKHRLSWREFAFKD